MKIAETVLETVLEKEIPTKFSILDIRILRRPNLTLTGTLTILADIINIIINIYILIIFYNNILSSLNIMSNQLHDGFCFFWLSQPNVKPS